MRFDYIVGLLLCYKAPHLYSSGSNDVCSKIGPRPCICRTHTDGISISCERAGLTKFPEIRIGNAAVRTLDLTGNHLHELSSGAFFGWRLERLILANNSITSLQFLSFWGLEYYLHSLDLAYNKLGIVPSDALRLLPSLKSLTLTGNKISFLRDHDFLFLSRLEMLSLDKNPIQFIDNGAFAGTSLFLLVLDSVQFRDGMFSFPPRHLRLLRGLSLNQNNFNNVPEGWAFNLPSVRFLSLEYNNITELSAGSFIGLEHCLRTLELNGNKLMGVFPEAIRPLFALQTLELRDNQIKTLPPCAFNGSRELISLDLSRNQISSIDPAAFQGLNKLERLDLRFNQLTTLEEATFSLWGAPEKDKPKIFLSNNHWLCNCLLQWMKKEYRQQSPVGNKLVDLAELKCVRPDIYANRHVVRLSLHEFTCDHDYYYYYYDDEYDDDDDDDEFGDNEDGDDVEGSA